MEIDTDRLAAQDFINESVVIINRRTQQLLKEIQFEVFNTVSQFCGDAILNKTLHRNQGFRENTNNQFEILDKDFHYSETSCVSVRDGSHTLGIMK